MLDYNYEKVLKRIEEGHLRYFSFVDEWKEISPALILHFDHQEKVIVGKEEWINFVNVI